MREVPDKGVFHEETDYYETREPDGVLYMIKIKDNLDTFWTELVKRAKYFENIQFNFGPQAYSIIFRYHREQGFDINRDFKIYKSDNWIYSTMNTVAGLHICLDQYSYDIRWTDVGVGPVDIPLGLKFKLDELEVNPTREQITVGPEYGELVLNKIRTVADELVDKWNEQHPYKEFNSIKELLIYRKSLFTKIVTIDEGHDIDITKMTASFCQQKEFNGYGFKGVRNSVLDVFIDQFEKYGFSNHWKLDKAIWSIGRRMSISRTSDYNNRYLKDKVKNHTLITPENYLYEDKLPMKTVNYLKSLGRSAYFYQEDKITDFSIGEDIGTQEELDLLENSFRKDFFIKIEDVVISEDYLKTEKAKVVKKRANKEEGQVGLWYPRLNRFGEYSFDTEKAVNISDLRRTKGFWVYGLITDKDALTVLKKIGMNVVVVNVTNKKVLDKMDNHNYVSIGRIDKSRYPVIGKHVTAILINKFISDNVTVFDNLDIIIKYVSRSYGNDLQVLNDFAYKYDINKSVWRGTEVFVTELQDMCTTLGLWDLSIMAVYNRVKDVIDRFDFVDYFALHTDKPKAIKAMTDIARQRSVKMNWENYKLLDF